MCEYERPRLIFHNNIAIINEYQECNSTYFALPLYVFKKSQIPKQEGSKNNSALWRLRLKHCTSVKYDNSRTHIVS